MQSTLVQYSMQKRQLDSFLNSLTENYFLYCLLGEEADPFFSYT